MKTNESYSQLFVVSDSDGITSAIELQPQGSGTMVNVKLHEGADVDALAHSFMMLAFVFTTDRIVQNSIKPILEKLEDIIQLKEIPF